MDIGDRANNLEEKIDDGEILKVKDVSDGYHTFGDLYEHRHALLYRICLLSCQEFSHTPSAIMSKKHDDGTMFDDMFIVQLYISNEQISYHLPMRLRDKFEKVCGVLLNGDKRDGHTSEDVLQRLLN